MSVLAASSGSGDRGGGTVGRVRRLDDAHRLLELRDIRPHVREADAGIGRERQPDPVAPLRRHLVARGIRDDIAARRCAPGAVMRRPGTVAARPPRRPPRSRGRRCRRPSVAPRRCARVARRRGCGRASRPCPGRPCAGRAGSQVTRPAARSVTVAGSRLAAPTNDATNGVAGRPYSSSGGPACSMRPARITTTSSEIESASSWSWVTYTEVMPSCCWMLLMPSRSATRTWASSAESGSSSSSTPRLDGERPREGDALLLSARHLVRIALRGVADLDEVHHLADPFSRCGP